MTASCGIRPTRCQTGRIGPPGDDVAVGDFDARGEAAQNVEQRARIDLDLLARALAEAERDVKAAPRGVEAQELDQPPDAGLERRLRAGVDQQLGRLDALFGREAEAHLAVAPQDIEQAQHLGKAGVGRGRAARHWPTSCAGR